jgi:hypothetical protein
MSFFGGMELPVTIVGGLTQNGYSYDNPLIGGTREETRTVVRVRGGFAIGPGHFPVPTINNVPLSKILR